jgi:hypothetical protein
MVRSSSGGTSDAAALRVWYPPLGIFIFLNLKIRNKTNNQTNKNSLAACKQYHKHEQQSSTKLGRRGEIPPCSGVHLEVVA